LEIVLQNNIADLDNKENKIHKDYHSYLVDTVVEVLVEVLGWLLQELLLLELRYLH
jgi:hypothetical protein